MKFSTGLWDSLFGEKVDMEVRQDDGSLRAVRVTKAWLEKMQRDGRMSVAKQPANSVHLHICGPDGLEQATMRVGLDVPEDVFKRLVDPGTGALYGVKVYKGGKPEMTLVTRDLWEKTKKAIDEA